MESIEFLKEKQKEFNVELDENLLKHLGFLYIRDPLVIFKNPAQNPSSTADFEVFLYFKFIFFKKFIFLKKILFF